jgi:membrane fusion protein, heavy metal efflux system
LAKLCRFGLFHAPEIMYQTKRITALGAAIAAITLSFAGGAYFAATVGYRGTTGSAIGVTGANAAPEIAIDNPAGSAATVSPDTIQLTDQQIKLVAVDAAGYRDFPIEKTAVGSIDFNEELLTQVFTPYQGRIVGLFAKVGDEVQKGQVLFTIDSPDLVQASSTLISAASVLDLTTRNLERLKMLYATRAVSQKDLDQGISDQQSAQGAYRAARDAVRIFGKSDADMDRIVQDRHVDPTLVVPSPIAGRITARNAAPGLLVEPGNAPAPYTVADISTMWMLANVAESDSPAFKVGQEVKVSVMAFPGRLFEGRISTIGSTVDPATHRVLVRSDIQDPQHELRSGMFATFVIQTGTPVHAVSIPENGIVREGDGTMTAWVTTDRRRFTRRTIRIGMSRAGYDQVLDGLQPGELVATEGALFLSNAASLAGQ